MLVIENDQTNALQGSAVGLLIMRDVANLPAHEKLELAKHELTSSIREKFSQATRGDIKSMHPLCVYAEYYKRFGYSYHVLLQLESVVFRGKTISSVSALVTAMFMAELKNTLLTAGHDIEKTDAPLYLKISLGNENYTGLNGKELTTIPGDMMITDSKGVISSILRGPDQRTSIDLKTNQVVFTVYALSGIDDNLIVQHLNDIESYIQIFSDAANTNLKKVYRV